MSPAKRHTFIMKQPTRLYNNPVFRYMFHLLYRIKRVPVLLGCSIRQKIMISFLFVSAVPLLCSGIAQYIYTSATYPRQLEASMYETLKQANKNITYELNALARDRNLLLLNTELIRELDFEGQLSEQELIHKITRVDSLLNYANDTINSLYDSQKSVTAYVDWPSIPNAEAYFNTPLLSTVSKLPQDFLENAAQAGQQPYWRGLHTLPNRLDGEFISILNPIVNFDYHTIGYIEINLDVRELGKLFNDITFSENAALFLLDSQNQIIETTDRALAQSDFLTHAIAKMEAEPGAHLHKCDGYSVIVRTNELSGFRLVAAVPAKALSHQVNASIFVTFVILFGCVALSLALSFPVSYSLYSPIVTLSTAMKNARDNNYKTTLSTDRTDEIGTLYHSFHEMEGEIRTLIGTVYRSEIERKEAELNLLQANINPHFLYNTLDTINWLAVLNKQNDIALMARSLADIFRYSLSRGKSVIPVRDELKLVENYVSIQTIRLGGKVTVHYEIDPSVYQYETLKILLQPLVENAFLHGSKQLARPLSITIRAWTEEGNLLFSVADNGPGTDIAKLNEIIHSEHPDKGYGIRNVNKRIQLYYGAQYGLRYTSTPGGGLTAVLRIKALLPGSAEETPPV